MGKDRGRVQVSMDFDTFQDEARSIHENHAKHYSGIHYWDNSDIDPNNSNIPSETKTNFHLNQAKKNGTLDSIKNHHEPMAFTSNSGSIKLRCWNLARISFLAREGSAIEQRNYNEFEVWIRSKGYDSTRKSIFEEIQSL